MQGVGDGDVDNINVWSCYCCLPIGCGLCPSPLCGCGLELALIASADDFHAQFVGTIKEVANLTKGVGMGLGNETRADHSDVQLVFGHGVLL
jgi:hypothetical protein